MQDIKKVELEREPNANIKICFEVRTPSPISSISPRRISIISTKDSTKNINSILYTRRSTKLRHKSMHKAITSTQEGRHKTKAQRKRVVTMLGDHKHHK